jgi:predicted nucleic acid-binding protein
MFLDTSGFLCMLDRRERLRELAIGFYRSSRVKLTHSLVVAELVALATSRGVPREGVISYTVDLLANPDVEIVWSNESAVRAGMDLLLARSDKNYSLCDAVIFLLMRVRGLTDALTTDKHFEQEGFRRLLV